MKLLFTVVSLIFLISACTSSSTGRKQVMLFSETELAKLGEASFDEMKKNTEISLDKDTNDFVQCVASAITENVDKSIHDGDWEVVVFDSAQVNAFALPGGKIGVYTGILNVTENQDQLAAIIGHEVGHVIEHHSNERLSAGQLLNIAMGITTGAVLLSDLDNKLLFLVGIGIAVKYGVTMPYKRSHESEADIVGQDLMARSGFDPKASIKLWQNMARNSNNPLDTKSTEFMSTHPSSETRIKQLEEHLVNSMQYYDKSNAPNCIKPKVIPAPKESEPTNI